MQAGLMESFGIAIVLAGIVHLVVSLALYAWGRSVARRRGGRGWRYASRIPIIALALGLAGMALGAVLLARAYYVVSHADPSIRSTILSESIANATNVSVVVLMTSHALYLASLLAFALGSLLPVKGRSEAIDPHARPGDGPHRRGA